MKKRSLILTSVLLLLLSFCNAQRGPHHGQLIFTIGPSFPIGQYASKDILNDRAGIAGAGGAVNFSYTRLCKRKIGIAISLLGQINPLDKHSMERSFDQLKTTSPVYGFGTGIGEPGIPSSAQTVYPNWKFKRSSWKMISFLAGAYGEFKTGSPKIAITSKAMLGLVYASSPKIDGSSITDTTNVHVTQSSKSAFGFGYSLDGGIKIKLNKKICFHAGLEYFGTATITFKNVIATVTGFKTSSNPPAFSAWQSVVTVNGKQKINTLNLLIGLGLQL